MYSLHFFIEYMERAQNVDYLNIDYLNVDYHNVE